jgi:hypothetical protein
MENGKRRSSLAFGTTLSGWICENVASGEHPIASAGIPTYFHRNES